MNMNTLSRALVLALALPFFPGCSSDDGVVATPPVTRTLTVLVTGNGTVSSADGGITACSSNCSAVYDDDAVVTLVATAGSGSVFRAWTGLCTPVTNAPEQCDVTMTADLTVAAVFDTPASGGLGDMFALTKSGRLLSFDRASPGTILSDQAITGIGTDQILTIDYRPSNGLLFAVARRTATGFEGRGRLYIIDEASAVATLVAEMSSDAGALGDPATWNYEMAFQPGRSLATGDAEQDVERIRMLAHTGGATGKLFTINPDDGATTITDQETGYSATGLAYTNAFKGTAFRTAYAIEADDQMLAILDTTGSSSFTDVGGLGIAPDTPATGFTIDGETGAAWVAFNNGTNPALYSINLTAGTLSGAQQIGDVTLAAEQIAGLAIGQPLEPQVFGICAGEANGSRNPNPCVAGKTLIRFNASTPANYSFGSVGGDLGASELIIAMDVKPSTGELYALSDAKKIYTINTINAAATLVSVIDDTKPWDLGEVGVVGFDFNPNGETLRIVGGDADGNATVAPGSTNINFTVDPSTNPATVTVLAAPQQVPFKMTSVAFSGNVSNSQSTVYYGIDSLSNRLFTIDTNTSGEPITTPGRVTFSKNLVGITATDVGGFEVVGAETAYLLRSNGTTSSVYTLILATGTAAQLGAGPVGSSSGFAEELVGLTATVNQGANTKLFAASTGATPRLVAFKPSSGITDDPRFLTNNDLITGLGANETILALDFRFSNNTNTLYLLAKNASNQGRLYTVDTGLLYGAATPVGLASGNLHVSLAPFALEGTTFGMDVNPTNGSIRIVSDTGQNLSVDPTTAQVTEVADLAQTPIPSITAAAYSRNFAGSTGSELYLFDTNGPASSDQLMTVTDPGQIVARLGPTGIGNGAGDETSFDVLGGHDGLPLATEFLCPDNDPICAASSFSDLWAVDLSTGVATRVGTVGVDSSPQPNDTRIRLRAMASRFPQ